MTVAGSPFSRMTRPLTAGSDAKRRCHRPCAMSTSRSRFSSPGANVRPTTGWTPRTSKNCALTRTAPIRSGSPSPVRLTCSVRIDAKLSKVVCRVEVVVEVRGGRRQPIEADALPDFLAEFPGHDDAIRIRIRKRTQQDRVEHAEDGGVRADAEGQSQNRDGGEGGASGQTANC